MENIIALNEIEDIIKEIFTNTLVKSVDTTFEEIDNRDENKLVISIHQLDRDDIVIVHTKFIFFVDAQKQVLINKTFSYLYDINCHYKIVNFSNVADIKEKINKIINQKKFGKDIVSISEFLKMPVSLLNSYLNRENITDFTIYDVIYEPKFKMRPCNETDFDFVVNVDNKYQIDINIKKDVVNKNFKFYYKYNDTSISKTYESIQPLGTIIARDLVKYMNDTILK